MLLLSIYSSIESRLHAVAVIPKFPPTCCLVKFSTGNIKYNHELKLICHLDNHINIIYLSEEGSPHQQLWQGL